MNKREERELKNLLNETGKSKKLEHLLKEPPQYLKEVTSGIRWAQEWEVAYYKVYKCTNGKSYMLVYIESVGHKEFLYLAEII